LPIRSGLPLSVSDAFTYQVPHLDNLIC
jgi:hypothetical protein